MAAQERIWQVDENDTPIGPVGRDDSRKLGLKYRIVRVSVEDKDGNILIQKRLETKKTYPGCWDTSVGGNIAYPESYETAAEREMQEEIGLEDYPLEEVAYFYSENVDPNGLKMNRFTKVYRVIVPKTTKFIPQETEVSEVRWVTKQELLEIAKEGHITDGLKQVIEHYYNA